MPIERGAFRLFKLQQPVGREEYEVRRDGRKLVLTASSTLEFLGGGVPLAATLRMAPDLSPDSFEVRGRTSTMTDTDNAVRVQGRSATVRRRGETRTVPVPDRFFTIGHYGPVSLEQALFRYWTRHGRPSRLEILPAGRVGFEHRGRDTVTAGGETVVLDRYSVDGLGWGRKSTWIDGSGNLVATVGGDAELDRFEAIREGYETALPVFVAGAVRDGLADLARVAARVKPERQGTFAIVGARLVDGTGRPPVADAVVLIRDGRIAAAGPRSAVPIPRGTPRVDARGKTVLPGLWDMHGHYEQVEWPAAALAAGITTVRDVANEFELVTALRDAIYRGEALGPRMLLAGVIDGGDHPLGVVAANTPEEARAAVNRYHRAGFQQVKVYQSVRPELVPVIAAEAHRLGMTVTGHVPTGMTAVQFVEAGADQINHIGYVAVALRSPGEPGRPATLDLGSEHARSVIRLLRERGTVVEPTLARTEQHAHPRDTAFVRFEPGVAKAPLELQEALNSTGAAADAAARTMAGLDRLIGVAGALHEAGVPLILGSDLVVPGHTLHREMELAVRAGMTPMEALQAATLVPARVMGLDAESGSVEAGKRADLVLVDGDPLRDISEIRKVSAVVTQGRMYRPAELWRSAGFEP
ncbi:MAG TPA: amidohydrolase family protein [Longimicrobiaceae bacterium]|nr:amidohydrolase family protein [Longimicrobiaceae bacterium]